MIDSHLHLSSRYFDQEFPYITIDGSGYSIEYGDRDGLIEKMKAAGISFCIEPAIEADSNERLIELHRKYPDFVYPVAGNHPTRCIRSALSDFGKVKKYAAEPAIIAIGETGLDYHFARKEQHRLKQKIWFLWQIGLADKLRLPLVLHIRMADDDAVKILRRNKKKLHGGVCHCFGGNTELAKIYTEELGLHLGIGGTLLMKPEISEPLQEAVRNTPVEYLLLETDGPYVKPVKPESISGKKWMKARNNSLILPAVAEKIAELKGITAEEVIKITDENTKRLFRIKQTERGA